MQTCTDGYRATLCGRVIGPRGEPLKLRLNTWGYPSFSTNRDKKRTHTAHRFVYEFFKGKVPEGLVVNHKDGDKTNNRITNLEAVTQYENCVHGRGTTLSRAQAEEIRASKEKQATLAMKYGVHQTTISNIKRRKTHNG